MSPCAARAPELERLAMDHEAPPIRSAKLSASRWFPWALSALLAALCGLLFSKISLLNENLRAQADEIHRLRTRIGRLEGDRTRLESRNATLNAEKARLQDRAAAREQERKHLETQRKDTPATNHP